MSKDGTQDSWHEVKSKVEGLGLKLKLHLAQEADENDPTATPGDTRAAIEEMGTKVQEAFNSFGTAAKDEAVQQDVKEIGGLLRDILSSTVSNVGSEVEGVLKRTKGEMADGDKSGGDA